MKAVLKMTARTIRTHIGRYTALLLIVALSVGFFAGLKITKDAMGNAAEGFLAEQNFLDFRLYSTLGFTEDDVQAFAELSGVKSAEGSFTADVLMNYSGNSKPMKLLAIPESVNMLSLTAGRMPSSPDECLADDERFTEEDIGKTISLSDENEESVTEQFERNEYTIVGLVVSPLYIGIDRGTTDIGSGALYSFLYLPAENFTGDAFTEISLTLNESAEIYSSEYDDIIEKYEDAVTDLCKERASLRYDDLCAEIADALTPEMEMYGITAEQLIEESGLKEPDTYVLTRDENVGYASFENDTAIVSGIANIFPIIFIVIAMLVCITTMTRMVDEERTQIGTLKSLGFGNGAITSKYLLYAGSATFIGWAVGFFGGTFGLPQVFWLAYSALYDFSPLEYLFSPVLAVLTLAVSLAGILGATLLSCKRELVSLPAALIRPRASKNGKRILLERITPFWNRLPFLDKITLRNMFRYKQRLIMMLVGIGCCSGLVVTAFGVRDSMIDIAAIQFDDIQKYDIEASFEEGTADEVSEKLGGLHIVDDMHMASVHRVDVSADESMANISLLSFDDADGLTDFWDFHNDDGTVAFPDRGEVIITPKIAENLELSEGDMIRIRDADMKTASLTVSGIFDNHIYNFVVMSDETYEDHFGEWEANTALLTISGDIEEASGQLTALDEITGISKLASTRETVDSALSCLDYIIWMVVLFSGALAFIVIFNLTNINLAERSREVATVQVLGFYPKETESYVLRENLILSVIAGVIGLPLGTLFHYVVMNQILIDSFTFDINITPLSYVMSFICTVLFALIVNIFMKRQIDRIHMAESLKAVE